MPYYVYRYMHPDYPWLYVGKTINLKNRIRQHNYGNTDNIDRKYQELLQESLVLYIEFANSTQMSYVESVLIDKYKPLLNKASKTNEESPIQIQIPKWKKYFDTCNSQEEFDEMAIKNALMNSNDNAEKLKRELESTNRIVADLANKIEGANRAKTFFENYKMSCGVDAKVPMAYMPYKGMPNVSVDDIRKFFKQYPTSGALFVAYGYDTFGEVTMFKITKNGLYTPDSKGAPAPFDYALFDILAVSGTYFCKYYPFDIPTWYMLQEIYYDEYSQKLKLFNDSRTTKATALERADSIFNSKTIEYRAYDIYDGADYYYLSLDRNNFDSTNDEFKVLLTKNHEKVIDTEWSATYSDALAAIGFIPDSGDWHNARCAGKDVPRYDLVEKLERRLREVHDCIRIIDKNVTTTTTMPKEELKLRQEQGIATAHKNGVKFGRPAASFPDEWEPTYKAWKAGQITATAAMQQMGLKRTTFYKLVKQYEQ